MKWMKVAWLSWCWRPRENSMRDRQRHVENDGDEYHKNVGLGG